MGILSLYASGYPRFYRRDHSRACPFQRRGGCDEEEVSAVTYRGIHLTADPENPRQTWWPRTADFLAEAGNHSPHPTGVGNATAMVRVMQRCRNLTKVLVFAHGWGGELQFGSGQILTAAGIVTLPDVSACFEEGGTLDLYACNVALSDTYMQNLANRLGVTVRGFSRGVLWTVGWTGAVPHRRITRRGIDGLLPTPKVTKRPAGSRP